MSSLLALGELASADYRTPLEEKLGVIRVRRGLLSSWQFSQLPGVPGRRVMTPGFLHSDGVRS